MSRKPHLEALGERVLPAVVPIFSVPPQPQYELSGQAQGGYASKLVIDGGASYDLTGTGRFLGLDAVKVSGWVRGTGMIAQGHASGELTLTNGKGSVTLDLTGPQQPGFSALPESFDFTVAAGTGAYARLAASGGTLSLLVASLPVPGTGGSFALTVGLAHKPAAALDGALGGQLTTDGVSSGAGTTFDLSGAGELAGDGQVTASGWLHTVGFIQQGHATGELTLTGKGGSVTLELRGPAQGAFAPLPGRLTFVVSSGTGRFAKLHGAGHIDLRVGAQGGGFSLSLLA
jgi:hypothetical protein